LHLIMEGERPKPVRSEIVAELMAAADASGVISTAPEVRPGSRVRFATGPFAGLVGTLLALDDDGRVRVLLEVLGSEVPVRAAGIGLVSAL
jgi:transcriptional antiterminator RfaH